MAASKTDPGAQKVLELLKKVRESKTVSLAPSKFLRKEVQALDGSTVPFNLRYYQVQGVFHFLSVNRMVLGDSTGLGKCQTGTTRLITSEGMVPFRHLAPQGVDVETATEGFYPMDRPVQVWTGQKMSKVSRFYVGGLKPTVRVSTRNNFQDEGSLNHPLLVRRSDGREVWVEMSQIREGDCLCIDRSMADFPEDNPTILFDEPSTRGVTYNYPRQITPDLSKLLGYIVGEGNRGTHGFTVTQCSVLNPEVHFEIRSLLDRVFGWNGNQNAKDRGTRIQVTSANLKAYLEACGVGEELSREKSVPWCVMQGTQEVVRGFLSALFEGEASVADGGVELSSASEVLIRDVQLLLLRFGVVSTLAPKRIKGRDHTYWRLTFFGCDADIFERKIGFRSTRKRDLLRAKLSRSKNPNKDIVPFSLSVVEPMRSVLLKELTKKGSNENRKGSGFQQFGGSFQSTLRNIRGYGRNPTYPFLRKMLTIGYTLGVESTPEFQALKRLVDNHYFYDPVVKIERGEAPVMDIEVDDPEHKYVANGIVSHNTAQAIAAMCYIWEKDPTYKVMVICPKSAIRQWASEVDRFAEGVKTFVSMGTPKQREQAIRAWAAFDGPAILVTNYHGLVKDWDAGMAKEEVPEGSAPGTVGRTSKGLLDGITANMPNLLVTFDEATAFKAPSTKTAQVCRFLSDRAKRVWGLTATLLKNNLIEGFGIYQVIRPGTFGSKSKFLSEYCDVEMQRIKGGGKIPVVKGYRNLAHFRETIEPYFYGRNKHEVATDLPTLQTKEVVCEMSKEEEVKYQEALSGVFEVLGTTKDYKETKALTSLIYLQEVCDSVALVDDTFKGRSAKESGLLDLITGEFEEEKIIVYTKYERMVTRLTEILKSEGIPSVRITGKESDKERKKAQDSFQDLKSKVRVVFITDAGSEAINLQAAGALVFYDAPWSWGSYVQCLGRMIRIGSMHQNVYAVHLVAERPGKTAKQKESLDHKVLKALRRKKGLIDQILGESAQGALRFERGEDMINDVLRSLREEDE